MISDKALRYRRVSTYGQTGNGDGVRVLGAADGRAIAVGKAERLAEALSRGALGRVVQGVAGAGAAARGAGQEEVAGTGVEVN